MEKKIIILGAGLTGLSVAYYLKKDYLILEKEKSAGGLCRSAEINDFTFDYTGHLLHLHQNYTKKLVFKLLNGNLKRIKRNSAIYFQDRLVPYPFQANLWALPEKIKNECIKELPRSPAHSLTCSLSSFSDWCLSTYGKGICKYFLFPYNEKIWLHPLSKITTEWVNPFIPEIAKKEVIEGAKKKLEKKFGYNAYFYYPKKGGIQSLVNAFIEKIKNIRLNSEAKRIDWKKKVISTDNEIFKYQHLISTIPLPELLNRLENLPQEINRTKEKLSWTSVLCVNLGIKKFKMQNSKFKIKNCHWLYFPEKEFIFYRVGFYHNFSSNLVPENHSSLYIEIAHPPQEKLDQEKIILQVKKDLFRCKILNEKDKILVTNILRIPYAYVVYDQNRQLALKTIQEFFAENNIFSLGRYGAWKYSFMEESILDGKSTAEQINEFV